MYNHQKEEEQYNQQQLSNLISNIQQNPAYAPKGICCPFCDSVKIQAVSNTIGEIKRRGYLAAIGHLILAICTCGLYLIIPLLAGSSRGKVKTVFQFACLNCGQIFNPPKPILQGGWLKGNKIVTFFIIVFVLVVLAGITKQTQPNNTVVTNMSLTQNKESTPTAIPTYIEETIPTPFPEDVPMPIPTHTPWSEMETSGVSGSFDVDIVGSLQSPNIHYNYYSVKPQGVFEIIEFNIYNNGLEPITVDDTFFDLYDNKERHFLHAKDNEQALEAILRQGYGEDMQALFDRPLNPGMRIDGFCVFDIPKDTKGLYVKLSSGVREKIAYLKVENKGLTNPGPTQTNNPTPVEQPNITYTPTPTITNTPILTLILSPTPMAQLKSTDTPTPTIAQSEKITKEQVFTFIKNYLASTRIEAYLLKDSNIYHLKQKSMLDLLKNGIKETTDGFWIEGFKYTSDDTLEIKDTEYMHWTYNTGEIKNTNDNYTYSAKIIDGNIFLTDVK
jgi:hypothetical protein